jgi:hypothetical protein
MTCRRRLHEGMLAAFGRVSTTVICDGSESTTKSCGNELALTLQAYRRLLQASTRLEPNPSRQTWKQTHLLVDQRGHPLAAQISGAHMHDSPSLIPLVESIPAVKGLAGHARKPPDKLHADQAYASRAHRAWLRGRGIATRFARYGVASRKARTVELGRRANFGLAIPLPQTVHPVRAASRQTPSVPVACLLARILAVCREVLVGL